MMTVLVVAAVLIGAGLVRCLIRAATASARPEHHRAAWFTPEDPGLAVTGRGDVSAV